MRVLVTGGAGYIGSVLTRMLLEKGYSVRIVDRLFFGNEPLKGIEDRIEIVKSDIRWVEPNVLKNVDVIMDLAALSNDPSGELNPNKTMEINYKGRTRIANMAKKHGIKKYIFASSCSVYGFQDGVLTEKSQTNPLTTYAKANLLADQEILSLVDNNFTATTLRQATVYGFSHRMRFDIAVNGMVLGFFKNGKIPIMRDGKQWRPFVHVKDTSLAFISTMEAEKDLVNGQVFHVGSNEQNFQIFSLAELVAKSMNIPFEYEWYGDPDHRSYRVSFDKIKKILKFKPKYTPVQGAKEISDALNNQALNPDDLKTITVKWYKHLIDMQSFLSNVEHEGEIL